MAHAGSGIAHAFAAGSVMLGMAAMVAAGFIGTGRLAMLRAHDTEPWLTQKEGCSQ
jgi:hypothetical protein